MKLNVSLSQIWPIFR